MFVTVSFVAQGAVDGVAPSGSSNGSSAVVTTT
jgi:hypothetical protein